MVCVHPQPRRNATHGKTRTCGNVFASIYDVRSVRSVPEYPFSVPALARMNGMFLGIRKSMAYDK